VINPVERYTVDETLSHPWIHADAKQLSSYDLSESLSELELFQNSRRFKAGINVIKAIHRMSKSRIFDEGASENNSASNSAANSALNSPNPGIAAVGAVSSKAAANKRMAGLLLQAAAKVALECDTTSADTAPNNGVSTPEAVLKIAPFSPDARKGDSTYFSPGGHVVDPTVMLPTPPKAGSLSASIQRQRVLRQNQHGEGVEHHGVTSPGVPVHGTSPPQASHHRHQLTPPHIPQQQSYVQGNTPPRHPHHSSPHAVSNPIAPFSPSKSAALSMSSHVHSPHSATGTGALPVGLGSTSGEGGDHQKQQAQLVDLMHSLHMENNSVDYI
jgi:glutamate synthase domain-containing protein 2